MGLVLLYLLKEKINSRLSNDLVIQIKDDLNWDEPLKLKCKFCTNPKWFDSEQDFIIHMRNIHMSPIMRPHINEEKCPYAL